MALEFPPRLTLADYRNSQRAFLWFSTLNAFSFAALAESVLALFALKLGASDFHVGLLSSYIHLTIVFMLVGKLMVAKWGAARTYGTAWFLRNLAGALLLLAPFLSNKYGQNAGLECLLFASFLFFTFRAIGVTANNVLMNEVTADQDRGRFIAMTQTTAYLAMLLMLIGLRFWFSGSSTFLDFQLVIVFGCITGMASAVALFKVKETETPRISSREPLLEALTEIYRKKPLQQLLWSWTMVISVIQLLVPFQVLALKNGYLLNDSDVISFVALQMLGGLGASYLDSLLLDRVGPRPVLIINMLGLALLCLLWIVAPAQISYSYLQVLFFFVGFCSISVQICFSHYFLNVSRKNSVLNLSLVMTVLQGVCAGLAGAFVGGGLLVLLPWLGIEGFAVYRTYFAFVFIAQLFALSLAVRLKPLAERQVKDVLGMMFSLRDWRAMLSLQKLSRTPELREAHSLLSGLGSLHSDLSEKTLIEYLDSPVFTVRTAALEAIDNIEFGAEAIQRLVEEVRRGEFTTAFMAAEILGKHHIEEAVLVLRETLGSDDFFLKGKGMVALAQLQDRESYPEILEILKETNNPRLIIHGARAVYFMGDQANVSVLLQKLDHRLPASVHDELMHSVFALLGWAEDNFRLMTLYNRDSVLGIDALLDEVEKRIKSFPTLEGQGRFDLLRSSLAELKASLGDQPSALIKLAESVLDGTGAKGEFLEIFLRNDQILLKQATDRLLFSLSALTAFLSLEMSVLADSQDMAVC